MRLCYPLLPLAVSALALATPVHAQGVDYQKAQQAGKVWERKQAERNLQQNRQRDRRPATAAERARFLANPANRADYNRLVRSVGTANADRWLQLKARQASQR